MKNEVPIEIENALQRLETEFVQIKRKEEETTLIESAKEILEKWRLKQGFYGFMNLEEFLMEN